MKKGIKLKYTGTLKDSGDILIDEEFSRSKGRKRHEIIVTNTITYILCYINDILCIYYDPELVLQRLDKYFKFKPGSVGNLDFYLDSKLKIIELEDGTKYWR